MKHIRLTTLVFFSLLAAQLNAQTLQSPYSNYGLGEFLFPGLSHNMAMGEVGIGTPSDWHINLLNPAYLTYNRLSSFQVGISGDLRQFNSADNQNQKASANLRFLTMSFPVVRNRWTTAFALTPLTTVKYNSYSSDSLDYGEQVVSQLLGEGGITQLVWANGFRLFKQLSVGVKAAYVFGSIDQNSNTYLLGDSVSSPYLIALNRKTVYSDFLFSFSLGYKTKLTDTKYLNFGAVYDLSRTVSGLQDQTLERQTLAGAGDPNPTILNEDVNASETLPEKMSLGLSYEVLNKMKVGADIKLQNWSGVNESGITSYRNTTNISAGIEFIPDIKSVNSYLKRINYRVGFSLKQLPYLVNDTEINDFGINFGASFPTGGYSSMDASFKIGSRGTTDNNLIRENYMQFVIGATINDRWFIKRRYD